MLLSKSMIEKLNITNYRNLENLELNLINKISVVIAPNSSGKTNLLEFIYFSIFGKSFKNLGKNVEIIGSINNYAKGSILWDSYIVEMLLAQDKSIVNRKHSVNGKRYTNNNLIYKFPLIVFAPQTVDLVSGEPSGRRKDLDDFLSIIDLDYSNSITRYRILLKNRNALLKKMSLNDDVSQLAYWTDEFIKEALIIHTKRRDFFSSIKNNFKKAADLIYQSDIYAIPIYIPFRYDMEDTKSYEETLRKCLTENVQKEIVVGKTLYGPHKDDYVFQANNKDLRYFGSRGQQRLSAFIFKIMQFQFIKDIKEVTPVFLIDDLFSELDESHRQNLSDFLIESNNQFIITSAEIKEIPEVILNKAQVILLKE